MTRGEDCDDGNNRIGDGCSNTCLHEGTLVDAPPRIDPLQTATARGVTPGEREGTAQIRATVDPALINRSGSAAFTVQCGFRSNTECVEVNGNPNLGVGTNSCCYPRPTVVEGSERPPAGASEIGRAHV